MIFQVVTYEVCQVTAFTDVEMTWNVGKGIERERRPFLSENIAREYIISMARDAILIRLEIFIKSVRNLAGHDTGYYHTEKKAEDIKYLWSKLPELNTKDFKPICQNIAYLKDKLFGILPGATHPYYKGMQSTAGDIIEFAKSNCEAKFENFINHLIAA